LYQYGYLDLATMLLATMLLANDDDPSFIIIICQQISGFGDDAVGDDAVGKCSC
jgi:hypothetical protein